MDVYNFVDFVPLSFSRNTGSSLVSGLTVSVTVKNAKTNASLLSSTSVPEISSGAGIYTYNWAHGLTTDTECLVTFTVGSSIFTEFILITNDGFGGRSF